MSPGFAPYLAFPGKARRAARVSPCAAAIAERLSPALTVTVVIGGRRISFARADHTLDPGLAGGWRPGIAPTAHAVDVGVETTMLRLTGIPSAREAAATNWATLSNWASV